MRRENQHGGRKCADLQNRLDMTSHENHQLLNAFFAFLQQIASCYVHDIFQNSVGNS